VTADLDARQFWDERVRTHGHTGDVDPLLYAYDQPQRLAAVRNSLARSGIQLTPAMKVLDLGCGTGDFIAAFLEMGARDVTGVDFSREVLAQTQQRFAGNPLVRLMHNRVEELALHAGSFDLITGINVLQHLTTKEMFSTAVETIVRLATGAGHVLVMDFSPIRIKPTTATAYIIMRTRDEYVATFEQAGCRLVGDYGLPRIGVRAYRSLQMLLRLLRKKDNAAPVATASRVTTPVPRSAIGRFVRRSVLRLAHPLDSWLFPFPAGLTDMRILVFKKSCTR